MVRVAHVPCASILCWLTGVARVEKECRAHVLSHGTPRWCWMRFSGLGGLTQQMVQCSACPCGDTCLCATMASMSASPSATMRATSDRRKLFDRL